MTPEIENEEEQRDWYARLTDKRTQEQLRGLGRWLIIVPVLLLLLFGCSEIALWGAASTALADTRSKLQADYKPWPYVVISSINSNIIEEIERDVEENADAESAAPPEIVAQAGFLLTPTVPPGSTGTPVAAGETATASATLTVLPSPTPTLTATAPTNTPTSTFTASRTFTPSHTPTLTFTPTRTPTRTPSRTPSRTPTGTLTPTRTPSRTNTPTRTFTPSQTRTATPTFTRTNTPTSTHTFTFTATFTRTNTATNTPTFTPSNTPTNTATNTPTFTPSNTPTNTATNTPTDTATNTPTNTATFTPTNTPEAVLSGRVFEDANYAGGPGTAFGGGDVGLPGVAIELYDSTGITFIASTTTNASGIYTFGVFLNTTYIVRAVSASIGDADTPPDAGFNPGFTSALAEQTYESNGVTGNGGAGAFGGNSRTLDDTATATGAGAGDTNVSVDVGGISIIGIDFGFTYTVLVNTENSGQGSLRQVISNANAITGPNTMRFELIGAATYTIQPLTALPIITDPLTIDGTTQAGFGGTPIIELDGTAGSIGLEITAGSSTVRGLVINGFDEGILLDTNGNNVVQGNYIGTNVAGTGDLGNINNGILIQDSANNTIGGTTSAQRNLISGNNGDGIRITGPASDGNTVQGNYIGTDVSGALDVGNSGDGIRIRDVADNNLIGGTTGTTVGGPCTGACNIIAFNDDGVQVDNSRFNIIQRNSFFSNTGLGIDLLPTNGVTVNDAGDPDAGANNELNFPIIENASLAIFNVAVSGEARPGATVELYIRDGAAGVNGEGRTFFHSFTVGATGTPGTQDNTAIQFSIVVPFTSLVVNHGDEITAIAIDAQGNTSEFAVNFTVP